MLRPHLIALLILALSFAGRACAQPADDANRMVINLPTALQLAQAKPIDIALAQSRLTAAQAQQQRARALWLPTVYLGMDYFRQDGQIQDVVGNVFGTSKEALMFGAGPSAVFNISEAIHAPLAAKQVVRAREADVQASVNDTMQAVAEAYFNVQQARGDVAGALEALAHADTVATTATELATGLAPPLEASRAKAERARRRQALAAAYERWRVAAAELARLLRLPPASLLEPQEPASLDISLIDWKQSSDDLIAIALTNRPELASRQALVQAALQRARQERQRPLTPTLAVRGNATNPAGTLMGGVFGGGTGGNLGNFSGRNSFDVQVTWEFRNLLFGDRAASRERRAENEQAMLELVRTQERIAAEVVTELARARSAAARIPEAAEALELARDTLAKSLEGMKQTQLVGGVQTLIIRPAEVVAAVQALAQAESEFYAAVADHNRAQFRLYRALGQPAQCLDIAVEPKTSDKPAPITLPPSNSPKAEK
jgi:outer membrane protein TolC